MVQIVTKDLSGVPFRQNCVKSLMTSDRLQIYDIILITWNTDNLPHAPIYLGITDIPRTRPSLSIEVAGDTAVVVKSTDFSSSEKPPS